MKNKRTTITIIISVFLVLAIIILFIISASSNMEKRDKEDKNFFFVENEITNEETGEVEIDLLPNLPNVFIIAALLVFAWKFIPEIRRMFR